MSAFGQTGTQPATPSGDTSATPPSTGQATTDTPEQGRQPTQRQDGFWGRFPTVPEDQREALEPHLKSVQAYVTRLEQATSPIRELGYTPQQVQGLATFAKSFDSNPLGTFLTMAQQLQASGVIHEDLDLRALAAVIQGQDLPEEESTEGQPLDVPAEDPWAEAPPWAQELRAKQQQEEQQRQEQARAQQEAREDAVLNGSIQTIKSALEADKWPAEYLNNKELEKDLIARFIVHGGSHERVLNELRSLRTTLLQGIVQPEPDPVQLHRGVPGNGSATSRRARQRPGDSFAQASAGAEQHLRAANRAAQQNG